MKSLVLRVRGLTCLFGALFALHATVGCTVVPVSPSPNADDEWDGGVRDSGSGSAREAGNGSSGGGASQLNVDAASCQPGDVRTFQPPDYRPAAPAWQGACEAAGHVDRFQQFYDACLGSNASVDACSTFKKIHPVCADCLVTSYSAKRYGPLIGYQGFLAPNVAGCLELTAPDVLSCAKSIQALASCELAACEANCPVTSASSLAAYARCATSVDQGGCAPYDTAAACASAIQSDASTGVSACLSADFERFFREVAPLFCGAPPVDAGGPVGTSATLDAASE